MDDDQNPPKGGKKRPAKTLRDAKVRELAASGKTIGAIANEIGVHRTTITKILTNEESTQLVNELKNELKLMGREAIETMRHAMVSRDNPDVLATSLKSAHIVLKSLGVAEEKLDLSHSFPEPTVINLINGGKVVVRSKSDTEDVEDEAE